MTRRKDGAFGDSYTIGLVADTHDVDDPVGVIEALERMTPPPMFDAS